MNHPFSKTVSLFALLASFALACEGGEGEEDTHPAYNTDSVITEAIQRAGNINTTLTPGLAPGKSTPETTDQAPDGDYTFGSQLMCTTTSYSLTFVPDKFVAMNPNADVLWPGSLVQGNSMASGILDPIPVKRAPGTVTLALASGGSTEMAEIMASPSLSAATNAINTILSNYDGGTAASFSYASESVYSDEQLGVSVGVNAKGTNWSGSASLKLSTGSMNSHYLVTFTQAYYTMAFDPPQGPAGVFDPSVTLTDLQPYVGAGNPPVYVASVTYGRILYVLFESSLSQSELKASVDGGFKFGGTGVTVNAGTEYQKLESTTSVKVYALGGNAQLAAGTVSAAPEAISTFLKGGANFGADNPGVPISYMIRYLADSSQVRLALTTEYTTQDCTTVAKGCDGVPNSGKTLDDCGVCGGDGSTCGQPCAHEYRTYEQENGAYVRFSLHGSAGPTASAEDQEVKSFANGNYYKYVFPSCRRVVWSNVSFQCDNGTWRVTPGTLPSFSYDYWCSADSNASQNGDVLCGAD